MKRALVVDDSQFMRTVIGEALEERGYEVVTASDGEGAIEAVERERPDVITMDVAMPGIDGIEATERIMQIRPTPILMLSAHTGDGADATLDALENGAVDFITKPGGTEVSVDTPTLTERIHAKIDAVAAADPSSLSVVDHDDGDGSPARPAVSSVTHQDGDLSTVIIGASTGGPKVVERIVRDLPTGIDARVLIVQHMPASFTDRFADRLDTLSAYDVFEAGDRSEVAPGEAAVASGGIDLAVTGDVRGRLQLETVRETRDGTPIHPSIDVTMRTAASTVDGPLVGVVLTGMGDDGVEGLAAVQDAGGYTIAQNEETSPVFGIPGQAIETGCVDDVRPDHEIVDGILDGLRQEVEING